MLNRAGKILTSKFRRAMRWEFWPMWLFYIPMVVYITALCVRYRGLLFLSCNPGMPMSGLIGEEKTTSLQQLQHRPELAAFCLIRQKFSEQERCNLVRNFMLENNLDYPVVLKPNLGQRGSGVQIVADEALLLQNVQNMSEDMILQEYIAGREFGVFYYRLPQSSTGALFSITDKQFPKIVGDGKKSLAQLMLEDKRTHYMAQFLLKLHAHQLHRVLAVGEIFQVVEIGSHCRGAVFKEGEQYMTTALTEVIDTISQSIEGFYFGRYDIRVPDSGDIQTGEGIKVIEVNGVTSESTNIYDPSYSLFKAYAILFKQWRLAFLIGRENIQKGAKQVTMMQFFAYVVRYFCS